MDESISQARLKKERALDRFEREAIEFHRRVRKTYCDRAARYASRIRMVKAGQGIEDIKVEVKKYVLAVC